MAMLTRGAFPVENSHPRNFLNQASQTVSPRFSFARRIASLYRRYFKPARMPADHRWRDCRSHPLFMRPFADVYPGTNGAGNKARVEPVVENQGPELRGFSWQSGYGIFSIGYSQIEMTRRYISNQEKHHKKVSFQDEFREFLRRYDIDFDERYLWD
jgi:hypothetical protein